MVPGRGVRRGIGTFAPAAGLRGKQMLLPLLYGVRFGLACGASAAFPLAPEASDKQ